ncbi:MAG: PAC2 family protein [Candidatus Freyarchaeota archaeon]|nr:PAC2 family protein [Candidatus Jordarchaeia archaeon]
MKPVPFNLEVNKFNVLKVKDESLELESILNDVKGAVCVQGMPGIANVGKAVVEFLIEYNNAKRVFQIHFSDFPSHVSVDDAGHVNALKSEVYFYRDERAGGDFFLLTGDAQPTSNIGVNVLSKYIANLLHELNVKLVVSLGAMPTEKLSAKPRVFAAVTSIELLKKYGNLPGVEVLREGVVIGMNGLVPCIASSLYGINGLILLSETLGIFEKDARASYTLAKILRDSFKLNINLEEFKSKIGLTNGQDGEHLGYLS